jgi:molybdopterin-containing oxidoreductase family molybdopterin binding subunit
MALEGDYEANGVRCQPAFQKLKDHLKKFTPAWGEQVSTVPAATIRRLGSEFAREARIGSTIVVKGATLPYRPVAAIAFRGAQGHMNSLYNFVAVDLLNQLVGAADVVGSCLGYNPVCEGHPETGLPHYVPSAEPDGIMKVGLWRGFHLPYPPVNARMPETIGLQDVFPLAMGSPFVESDDQDEFWEKFELPYRPEVLINWGSNLLLSVANRESMARTLAKYKFMVSFDLFLTETSDFADIVLPDLGYL